MHSFLTRGIVAAVLSLLLGACLGTSYPVWTAKESENIPALPGKWYWPTGASLSIARLPTGEYETRDENGDTMKIVVVPLQNDFHIMQLFSPENDRYYYTAIRFTPDMIELRAIDHFSEELATRATSHGIRQHFTTDQEHFVDVRRLNKRDLTGFFKDVLALKAWSHEMVSVIPLLRTPPQAPPAGQATEAAKPKPAPPAPVAVPDAPARNPIPLREIHESGRGRRAPVEPNIGR